jgi:hypothetical protein
MERGRKVHAEEVVERICYNNIINIIKPWLFSWQHQRKFPVSKFMHI